MVLFARGLMQCIGEQLMLRMAKQVVQQGLDHLLPCAVTTPM